jgi:hypothetical protein
MPKDRRLLAADELAVCSVTGRSGENLGDTGTEEKDPDVVAQALP